MCQLNFIATIIYRHSTPARTEKRRAGVEVFSADIMCNHISRHVVFTRLIALLLLALLSSTLFASHDRPHEPGALKVICGPLSMFIFLSLHEIPITMEEGLSYLPAHPDGMSLLDLESACKDFGLQTDIRKFEPADLRVAQFPLLALVHFGPREDGLGHYVVITHLIDDDRIQVIDGTTAEVQVWRISKLPNLWDGFALVAVGADDTIPQTLYSAFVILDSLFGAWLLLGVVKRRYLNTETTDSLYSA